MKRMKPQWKWRVEIARVMKASSFGLGIARKRGHFHPKESVMWEFCVSVANGRAVTVLRCIFVSWKVILFPCLTVSRSASMFSLECQTGALKFTHSRSFCVLRLVDILAVWRCHFYTEGNTQAQQSRCHQARGLDVAVVSLVLNSLRTKNTCSPPLPQMIQIMRMDHLWMYTLLL